MSQFINEIEAPIHSSEDSKTIISLDDLGIMASSLCLIHCLAMPFVIGLLPFLGWQFLEGKQAHEYLAAFVFAFAIFAIVPGYFKHHKLSVLVAMLIGLFLVGVATFVCGPLLPESLELTMITLGNLILVATHWRNRALARCNHEHHFGTECQ